MGDRSGTKYLRPQNGEARKLKCNSSVQRRRWEKTNQPTKKKSLRIDLPAILKSDFPIVWFLTTCNQLILVLSKQMFDHISAGSKLCVFQLLVVSENPVCSVAFMLIGILLMGKKPAELPLGNAWGDCHCVVTKNIILFTEGLKEHVFDVNGGILDFSPGFGLWLVKGAGAMLLALIFCLYILFPCLRSPDSLLTKGRRNVFFSSCVLTWCLSSRDSEIKG